MVARRVVDELLDWEISGGAQICVEPWGASKVSAV